MGRAREKWFRTGQLHGPCSSFWLSTGRVREACALISSVARGVLINTDRVRYLSCTGLGRLQHGACRAYFQHGACELARVTLGSARVKLGFARVVQYFLFFEVGTLIFLSIQGYFVLRILIGLIKDPMNEFG